MPRLLRNSMLLVSLLLIGLNLALFSPVSSAVVDIYEFDTESQRERYHQLSEVLRCPKCQNQNLAGSDSQIAGDLRRELHRLLREGKTDGEIKAFMVERYGDFVLYKPPLNKYTLILWGLPLILALIGLVVIVFILRRRSNKPGNSQWQASPELSDSEQQQLDELLATSEEPQPTNSVDK